MSDTLIGKVTEFIADRQRQRIADRINAGDEIRIDGGRKVCRVASVNHRDGIGHWVRFCDGRVRVWDYDRECFNGSRGSSATVGRGGRRFPLCPRCWMGGIPEDEESEDV